MNKYLGNIDSQALEAMFKDWQSNPDSVEKDWQRFFEGFELARTHFSVAGSTVLDTEFKVLSLIDGYRKRGHLFTKTNPVRARRKHLPNLSLENFGLSDADLNKVFQAGKSVGIGPSSLKDIIAFLEDTYCHSVGSEFMYIRNPEIVKWLEDKIEGTRNKTNFTNEQKKHILHHLKLAVGFEQFIHKKFVGQKRFSLEGAESLIPALDSVIEHGALLGIEEFVVGMAHRGRLNVLSNIMGKPYEDIFGEFIGEKYDDNIALGDVKYHLSFNNTIKTDNNHEVKVSLVPNPSHLETVGPVVQGIARARIEHTYHNNFDKLAPIVIHGDAAVAAQGVVYETLQMSQLDGYKTGGTIHIVINNQVGFTTNYLDARSSTYSTDIGKVTLSPVFHVNGDDPEALIHTIKIAVEYRQKFHTDVFIDLLCYRRYGHNEGDEPRFTQPTLYDAIAKHPNVREIYSKNLVDQGVISSEEIKKLEQDFENLLDSRLESAKEQKGVKVQRFMADSWKGLRYSHSDDFVSSPKTGVKKNNLIEIANKINSLPANKQFFKKLTKLIEDRAEMVKSNRVDWAMAELLAYGSLLTEGFPVRISGQDAERGTFSHRHSTYNVENSDEKYYPLKNISENQAPFNVYNSLLSEYGVMGFEYGYSITLPKSLTIWEAQFGDFFNVAQVIIDQYISSAEDKWGLRSGLTLLLPHGFEGQGPEHSSARIERFLTLAAHNNMQITNCTTPANFFHLLRRQQVRDFRVPLVVFTPKSLLRHPKCVSDLNDLTTGNFKEVIDDNNVDISEVKRVVFCSGKIYYDLLQKKEEYNAKDIALVRIEQLYPFPKKQITDIIAKYQNTIKWLWVQEEPQNMGAWNFIRDQISEVKLEPICRAASGSPAVGLSKIHTIEQNEIIGKVFRKCDCELQNVYCGLQCMVGSRKFVRKPEHEYLE
ncbi:MAG: 2-oxoglutarate dehydrogenase E1 component [Tenuifilaceae bacterium]